MAERSAKWSVFDRIKSFPSTPEGLMSEISVAISAHEYAYSTALLESATVSSNSEEENTRGSNKYHTPSQHYSAKMADEAYKAGCAALAAGKLDEALQCLNVALCKCPPEKTSAVAKLQSLISLTSQQLRKSPRFALMTTMDQWRIAYSDDTKMELNMNVADDQKGSNRHNHIRPRKFFAFRAPRENFTIADFEFEKLFGIGSYSKVVRAKKRDTEVVCALKIMNKMFIIKQNRAPCAKLERLALDQLDHPGIVRLLFTFRDTSSLYMALEACEGGELFDQIARKGHLSEDEARFYTAEIVEALEYIHCMGLVHRDIKPENLLITADGHIKIGDFGCIRPMDNTPIKILPASEIDVINRSKFVGTSAYMSPEVLSFDSASFGNDLWALGCTLYQMLSGTTPFKDSSEWRMFQRILTRDFRIPNHFSEEAKDLIDRLLDMDPTRRLGTGPNGYKTLKKQPFFKGVNWKNLRRQTPPTLAIEPSIEESDDEDTDESSWDPSNVRWFSAAQSVASDRSVSSTGAPCNVSVASVESYDWQQVLEPGEAILLSSTVEKVQKSSNKKVQLILTDKPRLICTSPSKLRQEGDIIWTDSPDDLSIQVTSPSHFKICTPKRVISFKDSKQRANQWKKALEGLQNQGKCDF